MYHGECAFDGPSGPFQESDGRGLRAAAAGKMLLLSPATAARWGKPEPFVSFFVELIGQDPDINSGRVAGRPIGRHGVSFSTSGIDGLLRRHGYTYKKVKKA